MAILPLFVTLNVVTPLTIDFFDSVNLNSLGLPAVTVTVVADAAFEPPNAETAATSAASATRTTSTDPFRYFLKKPSSLSGTPLSANLADHRQRLRLTAQPSIILDDPTRISRRRDYRKHMEPLRLSPEPVSFPAHNTVLGPALRAARKAHGLSLTEVAEATGISRSLLSLIETGRSDITIGRLSRLAQLYELRIADLVPEPRHPDPIVVRGYDRPVIHYAAEGIDVEVLAPEGPTQMQALLATFLPGAAMQDLVVQDNEQFVHVLEGRIRTEFADGRAIVLGRGRQRLLRLRRGRPQAREPRRRDQAHGDRAPPPQ